MLFAGKKYFLGLLAASVLIAPGPVQAQTQSVSQQKCIVAVGKGAAKLAKTFRKQAEKCIKSSTTGVAAEGCITSDPRGRIQNASDKITAAIVKSCTPAPDFGVNTGPNVIMATLGSERDLATDMFGESFLDSLVPTSKDDRSCRFAVGKSYGKLADTVTKYFLSCVKDGLKTGQIDSTADMEACLDGLTGEGDGAAIVAKAVQKLMLQSVSKCDINSVVDLFPGVCGDTAGVLDFGACAGSLVKCRSCLSLNDVALMDRECDTFDDGLANFTCPPNFVTTTTSTTTSTTSTTTSTTSTTLPPTTTTTLDTTTTTLDTSTTTSTTSTTTTTLPALQTFVFDMACAEATLDVPLLGGAQNLKDFASVTVTVDLSTLGDRNGNGLEDVDVEITDLLFQGDLTPPDFVEVREQNPAQHPFIDQRSLGFFEESVNSNPGVLDIDPITPGATGTASVDVFIEAQVVVSTPIALDTVLHHDVAVNIQGPVSSNPPLEGDIFSMTNGSPIPIKNAAEADFFGTTITGFSVELSATTCEPDP